MPQRHLYEGHRIPAVVLANTFDYVVGVICILAGLRAAFEPEAAPQSIRDLPEMLTVSYRIILLLAGVMILYGLARRYRSSWGTAFERSGMWFAGTAFVVYGAAASSKGLEPSSFLAVLTILVVAAGCGVRALALGIESRNILITLKEAPRKDDP